MDKEEHLYMLSEILKDKKTRDFYISINDLIVRQTKLMKKMINK